MKYAIMDVKWIILNEIREVVAQRDRNYVEEEHVNGNAYDVLV